MLIEHLLHARHFLDAVGDGKINDKSLQSRCSQTVGRFKNDVKVTVIGTPGWLGQVSICFPLRS